MYTCMYRKTVLETLKWKVQSSDAFGGRGLYWRIQRPQTIPGKVIYNCVVVLIYKLKGRDNYFVVLSTI